MLTYIQGDLLATDERVIIHGCNAQGVMGSGVAALIRQHYPKTYFTYTMAKSYVLGDVIFQEEKGKLIGNCITQQFYGKDGKKYVNYDAIDTAIKTVAEKVQELGLKSFAMPMIGSGLGGGNWNIISTIIEQNTQDLKVIIYYL